MEKHRGSAVTPGGTEGGIGELSSPFAKTKYPLQFLHK
jgi:hypothetical protein